MLFLWSLRNTGKHDVAPGFTRVGKHMKSYKNVDKYYIGGWIQRTKRTFTRKRLVWNGIQQRNEEHLNYILKMLCGVEWPEVDRTGNRKWTWTYIFLQRDISILVLILNAFFLSPLLKTFFQSNIFLLPHEKPFLKAR